MHGWNKDQEGLLRLEQNIKWNGKLSFEERKKHVWSILDYNKIAGKRKNDASEVL